MQIAFNFTLENMSLLKKHTNRIKVGYKFI